MWHPRKSTYSTTQRKCKVLYTAHVMYLYPQLDNQENNFLLPSLLRWVTNKHWTAEARKKFLVYFSLLQWSLKNNFWFSSSLNWKLFECCEKYPTLLALSESINGIGSCWSLEAYAHSCLSHINKTVRVLLKAVTVWSGLYANCNFRQKLKFYDSHSGLTALVSCTIYSQDFKCVQTKN